LASRPLVELQEVACYPACQQGLAHWGKAWKQAQMSVARMSEARGRKAQKQCLLIALNPSTKQLKLLPRICRIL
jgi:hypothetical protein